MNITFQMNADSVNAFLLDAIKAYFTGKEIEISIKECSHNNPKIIHEPSPLNKTLPSTTVKNTLNSIPLPNEQLAHLVDELRFPILAGLVICGIDLNKFVSLKRLLNIQDGMFDCYEGAQKTINTLKNKFPHIYQDMRTELFHKIYKVHHAEDQDFVHADDLQSPSGNPSIQCVTYCIFLDNMQRNSFITDKESKDTLQSYRLSNGVFE